VKDQYPEEKDDRTDHEAQPVLKGIKYGANAWIHNRDYKKAYENNCQ
jgi:prolyl 4-hydroxylase